MYRPGSSNGAPAAGRQAFVDPHSNPGSSRSRKRPPPPSPPRSPRNGQPPPSALVAPASVASSNSRMARKKEGVFFEQDIFPRCRFTNET